MHIVRLRPMPPTTLSLTLLASIVVVAPQLYSVPRTHPADPIPGLTYEAERAAPHAPVALVVTSVQDGSAAARADIRAGDVIDSIDGKPIASPSAVEGRVRDDSATGIMLHIRHAGESRYKHLPAVSGAKPGTPHVAEDTGRRR